MFNGFLSTAPTLDFSPIIDALTGSMNISTVGTVIAAILGAGVTLSVFWWGGRKVATGIESAFKRGKIQL